MADEEQKTSRRVVKALSALYYETGVDPVTGGNARLLKSARRGDEIELLPSEEKRLDANDALMQEGETAEDAAEQQQALLDAYRGERGDTDAVERALERARAQAPRDTSGGVVNLDANVESRSAGQLAGWIEENSPSVDDTVALAENDPDKARKVLEAEGVATGQSPRKGVVDKLNKIIEG